MLRPGPRYMVSVLSFGFFLIGGLLTYFQLRADSFPLAGILFLCAGIAFTFFGFRFLKQNKQDNGGSYGQLSMQGAFSKINKPLFIVTILTAIPGFILIGLAQGINNPLGILGMVLFMIGFVCHGINVVRAMSR